MEGDIGISFNQKIKNNATVEYHEFENYVGVSVLFDKLVNISANEALFQFPNSEISIAGYFVNAKLANVNTAVEERSRAVESDQHIETLYNGGRLSIRLDKLEPKRISLSNINGQSLSISSVGHNDPENYTIDLNNYPLGIYYLTIITNTNEILTKKIFHGE